MLNTCEELNVGHQTYFVEQVVEISHKLTLFTLYTTFIFNILWFNLIMLRLPLKCSNFILKIFRRYSQNIPTLFSKYSDVILKIFRRCSQNIQTLFSKYSDVILKIFRRYSQNIMTLFSKYYDVILIMLTLFKCYEFNPIMIWLKILHYSHNYVFFLKMLLL